MIRRELLLFEKAGPENTEATLQAVRRRAGDLGIEHVVLATSTGATALKALDVFEGAGIHLVGVTLSAGYWQVYEGPEAEAVENARARGADILTATHTLMGCVESAIRDKFGGVPPVELIAQTYYTFSQGMKVAVEVAMMAADAGLIPPDEDVIAAGGTNHGADTAIVLRPACSIHFFDVKVREVIAMPR